MIIRALSGLYSAKRIITLFIIFQALVILFFLLRSSLNNKYPYDTKQLASLINSKEFNVKHATKNGRHINNKVYLDEEGVFRSAEDYNLLENQENNNEHEQTEEPLEEDGSEQQIYDLKKVESNNIKKKIKKKISKNRKSTAELKELQRETSIFQFSGMGDLKKEISKKEKKSAAELKELRRETSIFQFSGMGGLKKEISKKVKNSKERFVADRRILFSDVYEKVDALKDVELLVIVSSSAKKRNRRDAIRGSWWEQCKNEKVACYFFTDDINSGKLSNIRNNLLHESRVYKDVIFQPIDIGVKFGYRFLYQLQWALANYRFKYILRVDDDVMMCLHHLLHDLKNFPKTNLQWGTMHCDSDGAVYIDEGITMLSRDLVIKFLSQNPFRMRCHVYGDQQIATWIQDLHLDPSTIYVHDPRIHHTPPAFQMREYFLELDDICSKHIAVHGVYPEEMEEFWTKTRTTKYDVFHTQPFSEYCEKDITYQWNIFGVRYRHQPKYCYKKPVWKDIIMESADGQFEGREFRPDQDKLWENMKFSNR